MSSYNYRELDAEARKRYLEKLGVLGLEECPYEMAADLWQDDPTTWPTLEYPEVYTYLIDTPGVFTRESMKNRKSLEAHNQFSSGWVQTVFHYVPSSSSDIFIMKADVKPSQRLNDPPHTPWISINKTTTAVINAHCTCMAGLGESCSHVAALLFKVEAAVRAGYTQRACTEEACIWNNDFKDKVACAEIADVKFYTEKAVENYKKGNRHRSNSNTLLVDKEFSPTTENDFSDFLCCLSKQTSKPVVLHCYSDFYESFCSEAQAST